MAPEFLRHNDVTPLQANLYSQGPRPFGRGPCFAYETSIQRQSPLPPVGKAAYRPRPLKTGFAGPAEQGGQQPTVHLPQGAFPHSLLGHQGDLLHRLTVLVDGQACLLYTSDAADD